MTPKTAPDMSHFHRDLNLAPDTVISLPTQCIVCQGPRGYIGVFTYCNDGASFDRHLVYALCERCFGSPGVDTCVEAIIEAMPPGSWPVQNCRKAAHK